MTADPTRAIPAATDAPAHSPRPPDAMGERVEVALGPARRAMLVMSFGWFVLVAIITAACFVLLQIGPWTERRGALLAIPVLSLLAVAGASAVVLACMRYELTTQRVRSSWGVLSRASVEARLEHVQNVVVARSVLQRLLALGTIQATTAGFGPPIVWWHVARPDDAARRLREAIDAAHARSRPAHSIGRGQTPILAHMARFPGNPVHKPAAIRSMPVLGLAGGIGSGKSTVARAFERLGCHVIDSDARAKAALDRPEVRDQLVRWWGAEVLDAVGRIDRAKVASIVFSDPEQRERLERLVHPIVREDRAAMVREAEAAGARAAIVDAPLLFEAGVDAECDVVVFVDAPREQRVERVRQTRGWSEQEIERRELAQMPLEEKRRRAQYVVENHGKLGGVDAQVARTLALIESDLASRQGPGDESRPKAD